MKLHAVDGLVGAQVHVAGVCAELPVSGSGQTGMSVGLATCGDVDGAVFAGFLLRLFTPTTSDDKVNLFAARQVEWHDGVFSQATTLHEQDVKVFGNGQQFTQVGLRLFVDADELFGAMAHLHHAHATAMPVQHFTGGLGQHLGRHRARAG